jgi:hypothetical protein
VHTIHKLCGSIFLDRLFLDGGAYLARCREFAGGLFGVDLFAGGEYLETTIVIWHEGKLADTLFILGEQFIRQTDGFGFVSSGSTVLNADLHGVTS